MKRYIALLRGVNVGGKNKVSMAVLKSAFEGKFLDVSTYINSGNVIFSCDDSDMMTLQQSCRKIIKDSFHLDIAVAVITSDELSDALVQAPAWWDADSGAKHNTIFVISPATAESVIETIGETKPEYEKIAYHGQVIFWSAPLETFSRTRLTKLVSGTAYDKITIRNANTTKKLLQLVK